MRSTRHCSSEWFLIKREGMKNKMLYIHICMNILHYDENDEKNGQQKKGYLTPSS